MSRIKSIESVVSTMSKACLDMVMDTLTKKEFDEIVVMGYKKEIYDHIKATAWVFDVGYGRVYWTGGELFKIKEIQ